MATVIQQAQALVPSASPALTFATPPTLASGATAGNLLIAAVSIDKASSTITGPSGYTLIRQFLGVSVSGAVYYKVATGGETTANYSWATSHYAVMALFEISLQNAVLDQSAEGEDDATTPANTTSTNTVTTAATTAQTYALGIAGVDSNVSWGAEATTQALSWTNSFLHKYRVDTSTVATFGHPGLALAERDAIASGTAVSTQASWGTNTSPVSDQSYLFVAAFRAPATGPVYEQNSFRARNDDGSEAAATWKAAANTNWTQTVDQNVRLRFLLKNSGIVPTQNTVFQLRYSKNGGAYTDVTATSIVARATASPNVTDGAALTEQMAGAGAYNPGTFDEADGAATCYTSAPTLADDTEAEFSVQLRSVDLANGDTVDFRLYSSGSPIATYTATPRATVTGAPASGSVTHREVGLTGKRAITVRGKFSGVTNVRLAVSLLSDLSSPTYSPTVAVDANGLAKCTVSGLTPGTHYYLGWERDGGLSATGGGEGNTLPSSGSFSFALASCADALVAQNPASMTAMLNMTPKPLFFIHTGDQGYWDINTAVVADHRAARDTEISYATRQSFYSLIPRIQILSDHDYCGNDTDRTAVGRDAAVQAFREYIATTGFVETATNGAIYQYPIVCGRCVFIPLDTRSRRDPWGNADSASKTMLGTAQKAWLKNVLLQYPNYVKFWIVDGPWIGGNVDPTVAYTPDEDHWGAYRYERKELTDFCAANNVRNNMILAGDMHSLALDDGRTKGTNVYSQGNFPVFQAAPLARDSSVKGGPYDLFGSPYPSGIGINSFQYGTVDVVDTGGATIDVVCKGWDSGGTQRLSTMTVTFTVGGRVKPDAIVSQPGFSGAVSDVLNEDASALVGS